MDLAPGDETRRVSGGSTEAMIHAPTRNRSRWRRVVMSVVLGVACVSTGAIADDLGEVIEQLASPSFVDRQAASALLGEIIDHNIERLYSYLEDPTLTSEQRYRVLAVAADKLVNRPRGALGISMAPRAMAMRQPVEIQALIAGMPAAKVLRVGDRIRRIDNTSINGSEALRWFVQSKLPGDVVLVTIDRPRLDEDGLRIFDARNNMLYETTQVEMELGSVEQLDRSSPGRSTSAEVQERTSTSIISIGNTPSTKAQNKRCQRAGCSPSLSSAVAVEASV